MTRDPEPPAPERPGREPPDRAPPDEARPDPLLSGRELPRSVYIEVPEHGLSDDELPHPAVLERIWRVLSRWAIPVMMTLAYVLLVATSDTDAVGSAVMGSGLVIVLVVWFLFRALTETAGLARAIGVGDVARLLAIADRRLPRARRPAIRAHLLVARALAHQLRGDPAAAIAALDVAQAASAPSHPSATHASAASNHVDSPSTRVDSPPTRTHAASSSADSPPARAHAARDFEPLAHIVRLAARIELGRSTADLRTLPPSSPRSPALTWLAEGQLAFSDGDLDTADPRFARVIDDIRAGSATRAMAHVYAARIADTRGDPTAAARHRTAAAALATPDAAWLRGEIPRSSHPARSQ